MWHDKSQRSFQTAPFQYNPFSNPHHITQRNPKAGIFDAGQSYLPSSFLVDWCNKQFS
jgi:hypothetical protein